MGWDRAQRWESQWWGLCLNTHNEETKQFLYAHYMGINVVEKYGVSAFDPMGASVIDIGGGPVSMLLKTQTVDQAARSLVLTGMATRGFGVVVDPGRYPEWVYQRYAEAGIEVWQMKAEDLQPSRRFDEAWIYNVLQHTDDPEKVVRAAMGISNLVRIFEWIDTPTNVGHPHTITRSFLDNILGSRGSVAELTGQSSCYGRAYYGTFKTI